MVTCCMKNVCKFDATTPLCYWAITVTMQVTYLSNRKKSHFEIYLCVSLILSKFPTKSVRIPVIYSLFIYSYLALPSVNQF